MDKKADKNRWQSWYEDNKERIAKARAERYANDPIYRAKLKENARARYKAKFGTTKRSVPERYVVQLKDLPDYVEGLTLSRFREWRKREYIPEPFRKHNEVWFTHPQVNLLRSFQAFFTTRDTRIGSREREGLQSLINDIKESWNGFEAE